MATASKYGVSSFTMDRGLRVAAAGVELCTRVLRSRPQTVEVLSVEHDAAAQRDGYDLVVVRRSDPRTLRVEVKADLHPPGNLALEIVSNVERGTAGCFLTSAADAWCYVFPAAGLLVWFPTRPARDWFRLSQRRFRVVHARTPVGAAAYTTRCCLVPVATLLREVRGSRRVEVTHL